MKKVLIIQTAFLGDVILATPLIEKLYALHSNSKIDFLLRSGNESILRGHPHIGKTIIWNKKKNKLINLIKTAIKIRKERYDLIINVHRYASSGLICFLSGSNNICGFDKNPFSFCYHKRKKHIINQETGIHETERNLELIHHLGDTCYFKPKLYPSMKDFKSVEEHKNEKYFCIAPASVWYTKQYPAELWIKLIDKYENIKIHLLGSIQDKQLCNKIQKGSKNENCTNLAGKLSILETAALMKDASMNFTNDSAPLHIASSMNAPITSIFCSTIPNFGFGPLSDNKHIIETKKDLKCRPCGLHGHKKCPESHFDCVYSISKEQIINTIEHAK